MITTLILDADGVLVNGERFADVRARTLKTDLDKEREFFTGVFQDCLIGKADLKDSVKPYLTSFGWQGTVDEFLDYWFKTEHNLNADLVSYIQKQRSQGIRVVLATNQEKYRAEYMLKHMGFDGMFDKVYASVHMGLKKPAVEFFARVVEDLDTQKDEVLFWDDDQRNIDGAREYGIKAEFYTDYTGFLATMKKYSFDLALNS
ncbi:MAG TPA: HAD-IA family hydrolase [Patescibacteria group bacterium]|jgi:putative hydrolase of the HAD superfamily|nr:HAD-IA family hydrolase [Patescibacteria group bacterium]